MTRPLAAICGCVVLALIWIALPALGLAPGFAGHMTIHMAVVAVAAPLLAVALAGTAFDPTPRAPLVFAPLAATLL